MSKRHNGQQGRLDAINRQQQRPKGPAPQAMTPEQQQQLQAEMQQNMGRWLTIVTRGILMRPPVDVKAHGNGDRLYVRVKLWKKDDETTRADRGKVQVKDLPDEEFEYEEFVLTNCPGLMFSPATQAHPADFKGEWPPETLIKEHNAPKPKIVQPSAAEVAKVLKQNEARQKQ